MSHDRRASLRYPCDLWVACRAGKKSISTRSRDISTTGISLVFDRDVEQDEVLSVDVAAIPDVHERTVRVVHRVQEAGQIVVGGEFTEPLRDENQLAGIALSARPVILVVEEENAIRSMLKLAFSCHGINVWPVGSGAEAITVCCRFYDSFDLCLIDVGMEEMDGMKTLAALKAIKPGLRCWFMTGGGGKYTSEDLRNAGGERVIEKPFDLTKMANELKQVCKA